MSIQKLKICFTRNDGRIIEYKAEGHAFFDEIGKDIVCSAVSALSQNVIVGILGYLKIEIPYRIKNGYLYIDLREAYVDGHEKEVEVLIETLYIMIKELKRKYPNNIEVIDINS